MGASVRIEHDRGDGAGRIAVSLWLIILVIKRVDVIQCGGDHNRGGERRDCEDPSRGG